MTENRRGLPTASATAKEIRTRILEETGLIASAGISYNKFLAKLASGHRKPNGQFVITPEMGAAWVAVTAGRQIPRGRTRSRRQGCRALGIETGADLRAKSIAFLQQHFGKRPRGTTASRNGDDDRPVDPDARANRPAPRPPSSAT